MMSLKSVSLALLAILACSNAFAFQTSVLGRSRATLLRAEAEAAEAAPAVPELDVSKLDIRVGVIEKCWEHEDADKLFCEEISVGEEEPRQIASGLKAYYTAEEMTSRKVLVLANLKTRKMVGFPSHGMVLCAVKEGAADDGSEDVVELLSPPPGSNPGDRIVCEGFDGEPATENQVIKKKMLNAIFPDLKVNSEGVAVYKEIPLTTPDGETVTSATLKDAFIS
jgi:aminoacyl tRNA synthase complex-interacting multifunctional protein 1